MTKGKGSEDTTIVPVPKQEEVDGDGSWRTGLRQRGVVDPVRPEGLAPSQNSERNVSIVFILQKVSSVCEPIKKTLWIKYCKVI